MGDGDLSEVITFSTFGLFMLQLICELRVEVLVYMYTLYGMMSSDTDAYSVTL